MDLPISGETRDEIARILEQVTKEGLDHPRNLDAAIDAIGTVLQGDPVQKITDIASGEVYWLSEGEDAQDAFGQDIIVQQGYFVVATE